MPYKFLKHPIQKADDVGNNVALQFDVPIDVALDDFVINRLFSYYWRLLVLA
jgi:hypothetical protein